MVRGVEEMGKEPFLVFREPEGFGEGGQRHLEETERVLEHDVTVVDGQGHDLGAVDDLFREDVLFVEFVQDQVRIEPLGIVRQDGELVIQSQLSQPIEEIANTRGAFKMEELVAVGGGGAHEIGYVNPCVLHGLTVPVHEQLVFGALALRSVRFPFPGFLSLLLQLGGVLDKTLMGVEIVVFFARGAFGRAAHVSRLDLTFSKKSIASRAFLGGPAHAFDLLVGIGFFPIGGRVRFVVGETLFPEEEPMTTAAGILERLSGATVWASALKTGGAFLALAGVVSVVVLVETRLALDAKLILTQETWERVAPVIVLAHFDEHDLFGLGRTFEDDLVLMIHGQDHNLMVNEMTLKGLEFGQPARPFGNVGFTMEVSGLSGLNRSTSFQTFVLGVTTAEVAVSFHGDDGACAAQFILVLDLDDALFEVQ